MRRPFEKIKLSQLQTFCNTLAETDIRNLSNVKRKYLERGLAFDETLSLLEDLRIVKSNSDELILAKSFSLTDNSIGEFKKKFLSALFSSNGIVSDELRNFLLNFQTKNEKIFFRATELEKVKFSDTRNLLLELEFISIGSEDRTYYVNPDFVDLFQKQITRRKLSPEALKKKQIENESIGLNAEKAVIEYELKRLAVISVQPDDIEHTSLDNVLAGYDIKSFEDHLDSQFKRIERLIEVKAVSVKDYRFYWSKTEIEIAKVYGEKYYLYLLPVISSNIFDFEKLQIISNPFINIYKDEFDWEKNEEVISVSKKS